MYCGSHGSDGEVADEYTYVLYIVCLDSRTCNGLALPDTSSSKGAGKPGKFGVPRAHTYVHTCIAQINIRLKADYTYGYLTNSPNRLAAARSLQYSSEKFFMYADNFFWTSSGTSFSSSGWSIWFRVCGPLRSMFAVDSCQAVVKVEWSGANNTNYAYFF